MKKPLVLLLGMMLGVAVSEGVHAVLGAVKAGKERRFVANVRTFTTELERYRSEHTAYPVACDTKMLTSQLGPNNALIKFGETRFQYCSDGHQYLLAYLPFGGGAYASDYGAPLLVAGNRLVAWPDGVSRENSDGASQSPGVGANP